MNLNLNGRSHYPSQLQHNESPPYRQLDGQLLEQLSQRQECWFYYQISYTFRRQHSNPPIWTDAHWHEFEVKLHLRALRDRSSMYGIDMIEVESLLKDWSEQLPQLVNDHPLVKGGTTEDLCQYFAQIKLDPHIEVVAVEVGETPNRVTGLYLS
jgi:hypothetical protein